MMENIYPISKSVLILMGTKLGSLTSLVAIILLCIVGSWVITLKPILHFLFSKWKGWVVEGNNVVSKVSTLKPCSNENVDNAKLYGEEVEMVMEKLGIFCELDGRVSSEEIATLFDENEPRLEEVQEAFGLFDENNDGYIDAKELEKILCTLGFIEVSERDCQRMITIFDDNKDGRIDFGEFVKLVENSFC